MTTSPWTDGYVTELPYTASYHPHMAPPALALALPAAGVGGPDLSGGFDYCELGFGRGFSLALHAAANPDIRFWGNDFNPEHAAEAETLGMLAGLSNLTVSAAGFADYAREELPRFDVVALHGIWSWVGPRQREEVLAFLDQHLKPGGIAYVSYNALPGWAQHLPLRQLMTMRAQRTAGPLADRIPEALDFARQVRGLDMGYFRANPLAGQRLDTLAVKPVAYLAHEYFNESWSPEYFADVAAALGGAGLRFAASAQLADRFEDAGLPAEAQALLAELEDADLRETVRDYLTNQAFRRDIFVRGEPRVLDPAERAARLAAQPFVRLTLPAYLPSTVRLLRGELSLDRDRCAAILDALGDAPRTPAELADDPALAGASTDLLAEMLLLLTAVGHAAPARVGLDPKPSARFNRAVADRARFMDDYQAVASPVLGAGLETSRVERLFLAADQRRADGQTFAASALVGELDAQEVAERHRSFAKVRQPILRALGIG